MTRITRPMPDAWAGEARADWLKRSYTPTFPGVPLICTFFSSPIRTYQASRGARSEGFPHTS